MNSDPYILITADTHAGGSHTHYREYLEEKYLPAFDEWRGGYKNPSQAHYGNKKARNWDFEIRSQDQNSQGVVGEVIFPNTVPPFFKKPVVTGTPPRPEDYELHLAGVRAHNRWLKDFCDEDPTRRAGVGMMLPHDFDEAIKDIEFIAKAGLRGGVLLPLVPPDATWLKPLFDPGWDRVFAAIQDHDLVMNHHAGQGLPDYGEGVVGQAIYSAEFWFYGQAGFRHLLLSGAFERFPKLKFILTESGSSWAADVLKQLDHVDDVMRAGNSGELLYDSAAWPLKLKPSEYAARNCYYGASFPSIADLSGIELVGEDHILWGNDYPHYEGTYPHTLESLRLTFAGMPDARRRKILGLNAAKLYKFDLEALKPLADKYGPTPAQIDQPLPLAEVPDTGCYLFKNIRKQAA